MIAGLLVARAAAQQIAVPDLNAQLYRPPVDSRHTLWADTSGQVVPAEHLGDGALAARVATHYARRPLVFVPSGNGGRPTALVSDVLQLDAVGTYAVDRLRLALDLPLFLYSAGQETRDGPGVGDVALDLRATLVDRASGPAGLAAFGRLELPTSTAEAPLGSPGPVGEVGGIVDLAPTERLLAAANLGIRVAPRIDLQDLSTDDSLAWRAGAAYVVIPEEGGASVDLSGQVQLVDGIIDRANVPVEILLGGWGRVGGDLVLRAGVGRGLTAGIGSAEARVVTLLSYEPRGARDPDRDGLAEGLDRCPELPEDVDAFQDEDGCPDPDDDGDRVADAADACPREPEDRDGYVDADGCPDPGVEVGVRVEGPSGDPVPGVRALITGPQHPIEVKGRDFVASLHEGRYSLTAAAPGFVGGAVAFSIPLLAERVTLVLQPDAPPTAVTIGGDRIELGQPVAFAPGSAAIDPASFGLLERVAAVLRDHPELLAVRVEAHTDTLGPAPANLRLSEERAEVVVRWLIDRGVDAGRLVGVGLGEARPVDARPGPEADGRNRRVEFVIERRAEAVVGHDPHG